MTRPLHLVTPGACGSLVRLTEGCVDPGGVEGRTSSGTAEDPWGGVLR